MGIIHSRKILGIIFLALLVAAVYMTYAVFTKKFTDYDRVTLQTSKLGLSLPERADIKIRGMIVGETLDYATTDDGAAITLGIYPEHADVIPENVTGAIYPKTLFGEKFIDLQPPENPSPDHIKNGDVIAKTEVATEVEKVLDDILPLLRTVQPQELNTTLNALATALDGRGEAVGETLETLDRYLKRINPEIPGLVEDLRKTAKVSQIYGDVVPELASTLRNTIKTGNTLEGREQKLRLLLRDVSSFSDTAEGFLQKNDDNLVRVAQLSDQQFELLEKYAPEYPCLLKGIAGINPRLAEAFRGFTLHIQLELIPNQPRGYNAKDKARYGDDRGPYCGQLPNPKYSQENPYPAQPNLDDGIDEPTGKGTIRVGADYGKESSYVGTPDEASMLKGLLAPTMGLSADQVPDLGTYLLGPMARGAEVSYR